MLARKRIILIDAVPWSPDYPDTPLRSVDGWFRRHLGSIAEIELHTLSADGDLAPATAPGVNGVILSGSPRDAWSNDPVNEKLCAVVRACQDRWIPFLGVCYGHQILGRALDARVARHPEGWELGSTSVELTAAGQVSPLFDGLPSRFSVLSSHLDSVQTIPKGCDLLARGAFTPIQSFHWQHRLFGVQFHPEMNPDIVRFLWAPRRERWRGHTSFDLDRTLDEMPSAPLAPRILKNFAHHLLA
ncbi:MAG TPA: gamma-glutamyl-gamma-aminobutyrate hydrolase family protein, partial [Opitutus sp.]|nr:gamma-glutamyl-gamma-aminobutyrate hydrolase family protein [Opitutus sp.]